jgi:hypothetical protein
VGAAPVTGDGESAGFGRVVWSVRLGSAAFAVQHRDAKIRGTGVYLHDKGRRANVDLVVRACVCVCVCVGKGGGTGM